MKRTLFNVIAAMSLLSCLAVLSLWLLSFGKYIRLYPQHSEPDAGEMLMFMDDGHAVTGMAFGEKFHSTHSLSLLPVAALLVLPALVWLIGFIRSFRSVPAGRCTSCGYDLRATPGRCPECGTECETATASKAMAMNLADV